MARVSLTIDGKRISTRAGEKLLWAALENDIYIPNLCAIREKPEPNGACRLCFVEIEGRKEPVTACTVPVTDGMVVNTNGEKALGLARTGFELLIASHGLDCSHCPANRSCELQKIARYLRVPLKPKRFRVLLRDLSVDDSNPLFTYNPNKCILCGRCIWACRQRREKAIIGFAHRGFERVMTTFADEPIGSDQCLDCGRCVEVCPTGALSLKDEKKAVKPTG